MKTIKNEKGRVAIDKFESVAEFVRFIESTKLNKAFESYYHKVECAASREGSDSFTGTRSFEEANDLLQHGYKEGLQNLMKTTTKLTQSAQHSRPRIYAAVVGFAPIVPNAIIGLPKSMLKRERVVQNAPIVNITYNLGLSASTDKSVLFKGGKNVMALVKSIEAQGYRVNLMVSEYTYEMINGKKELRAMEIVAKKASQNLNPMLLSYPLTHASFFRRHAFAWMERSEITDNSEWVGGYGMVFNSTTCKPREELKSKGILADNTFYVDAPEAANAESLESLYKTMGLTK